MNEHPRIEPQRRYIQSRAEDLLGRVESMTDEDLRWTVRLFADCLDPTEREGLLRGYNEYLRLEDLQRFVSGLSPGTPSARWRTLRPNGWPTAQGLMN